MIKTVLFVIIVIYGTPMWHLRYKFRKAVYKESGWKINVKPWFLWETIALFSNKYFKTKEEKKIGFTYRLYLLGFLLLWLLFFYL